MQNPDALLKNIKRLVVKVGSSTLAGEKGLRREWLAALAQDIAALTKGGVKVIVVSSGAVALGRAALGIGSGALRLEEKQAAAACGQIALVQAWRESLGSLKHPC